MLKKILALILSCLIILSFSACGKESENSSEVSLPESSQSTPESSVPEEFLMSSSYYIDGDYIHFPISNGGFARFIKLCDEDGVPFRVFAIALDAEPDYYVWEYVGDHKGENITVEVGKTLTLGTSVGNVPTLVELGEEVAMSSKIFDKIKVGEKALEETELYPDLYFEKNRPQLHFSSQIGWGNDINGLFYSDGVYHLCYQSNAYTSLDAAAFPNVCWGHATSTDLIHWTQEPLIFHEGPFPAISMSGTATIDSSNTLGFGEDTVLVTYTRGVWGSNGVSIDGGDYRSGHYLFYSTDGGKTFTGLDENPVVASFDNSRDPCLVRDEENQRWIMAIYEIRGGQNVCSFYESFDLKNYRYMSNIAGLRECPNLMYLKIEGSNEYRWVLVTGDNQYWVGDFEGDNFIVEEEKRPLDYYGLGYYAMQTFAGVPDGRTIGMGWLMCANSLVQYENMRFLNTYSIPVELTLREIDGKLTLCKYPITELKEYAKETKEIAVKSAGKAVVTPNAACDIELSISGASGVTEILFGYYKVSYDHDSQTLYLPSDKAVNGSLDFAYLGENNSSITTLSSKETIDVRLVVDAGVVECFINGGEVSVSFPYQMQKEINGLPTNQSITINFSESAFLEGEVRYFDNIWKQ